MHRNSNNSSAQTSIAADAQSRLPTPTPNAGRGLTVADVARRYRVSEDKVRAWIRSGELKAINTARTLCGRPRWVVMPEALALFEARRQSAPLPKSPVRRRPQRSGYIDYYPD
jgi:excisionase family DNA binding protein